MAVGDLQPAGLIPRTPFDHAERLEKIFEQLDEDPTGHPARGWTTS